MCIHYCKCPSVMPPDQKSVQKAVQAKSILKETPSCPASPTWKSVRSLVMLNICPCKQGREITCGSSVSITTAVTYVGRQPHLVDPLFPRAAKRSTVWALRNPFTIPPDMSVVLAAAGGLRSLHLEIKPLRICCSDFGCLFCRWRAGVFNMSP